MTLTSSTTFRSAFDAAADSAQAISTRRFDSSKSYCVQGFSGSVDHATAADFAASLDRVIRGRVDGIVLDFSALNFFGTAGLVLLRSFLDEAAARSIPVALVGDRTITRPLELCGMEPYTSVFATVADAGRALAIDDAGPATMELRITG